jgi:hypothetical protein
MSAWWTSEQAGLYGAIVGSAIGILGGIIGTAAGYLAPRGQARLVIYALCGFVAIIAFAADVLGVVALAIGQPWRVWWPLILLGAITSLVSLGTFPTVRARYREAELRRLEAEDIRRG